MKRACESCSGSGQISFFKGVSRFLLSQEECPECAGFGYIIVAEANDGTDESTADSCRLPDPESPA